MATKPSQLLPWCSTGVAVQPPAGYIANGFPAGYRLPAEFVNWDFQTVGAWIQYLNDGAFTGGVSVAGGLTADTATITGDFKVEGDYQPDGSTAEFLGDISCGNMEIQGDYKLTGGSQFGHDLDLSSDRVTGCAAYEYAAGFSPSQGIIASALSWFWSSRSITNYLRFGDRINDLTLLFKVRSSTTVTATLVKYDTGTATATTIQTWTDTTVSAHSWSMAVTAGGGYTLNAGEKLYLVLTNDSTGSSNDTVTRIYLSYDHP